MASVYCALADGFWQRKALMLFCVGIWSVRLGSFLVIRIRSHHPKEDGRYGELRSGYGDHVERGFFWFFQTQAWSVVLLTIPFLLVARNPDPELSMLEWAAGVLWFLFLLGEATADHQAKSFKSDPKNAKRICDTGLWKYSRHPNYFFESCIWWAYFLLASQSAGGIYTIYCPLIMLFLLLKVTGVPMSEKQSLKSKGDIYREYQKRTSKFIPWFPKAMLLMGAFLAGHIAFADADRTAKIYPLGKTTGEPMYIQKTHYDTGADGAMTSTTNITDAQGKPVLTEVATYKGSELILQKTDQMQTGKHYETETKNGRVLFRQQTYPIKKGENVRENSEGLFDNFVTGPTSEAYLANHWTDLMAGKVVEARFAVNEIHETVGFDFKLKEKTKVNGKDAVVVIMKPTSMFISMMVDPITLYLDSTSKRYVRFTGRTPLYTFVKGDQKALDADIIYE